MARAASLGATRWLPTYGWWPQPDQFQATIVVSPYHQTLDTDAKAEYRTTIRGYAGSSEPLWERDFGVQKMGEERALNLAELDVDPPESEHGAVVEIHTVRTDEVPDRVRFIGMWIDAVSPDGGGYVIPTQPIRGAGKVVARDDVQVMPGILADSETDTEVLLLNVIGEPVDVRLVASSAEGLTQEAEQFTIAPYSAWYGSMRKTIPRLRRLLESSDGIGSLAVYSSHRLLPHFGFRRNGGPVTSMDHSAPIFG